MEALVHRWPGQLEGWAPEVFAVLKLRAAFAFREAKVVAAVGDAREPAATRGSFPAQFVASGSNNARFDG